MKPLLLVPLAVVTSVLVSYASIRLATPPPAEVVGPAASADDLERLARMLSDLQARQESLANAIDSLRAERLADERGASRVPVGEIERAVERALASRGGAVASPAESRGVEVGSVAERAVRKGDVQDFLDRLLEEGLSQEDWLAIWKEAAEAGLLDELVARFEQRAKDDPNDPDAQHELGQAYLQKVFQAGGGPEAGVWATKADRAFDAALAIDQHHWDARFSKAVSLSFWPPVFGKQTEAIKQFETLIRQQGEVASQPRFAQTWLLLGNMYQQIGKGGQALSTWQQGLGLFPGNEALQQQIANAQGN